MFDDVMVDVVFLFFFFWLWQLAMAIVGCLVNWEVPMVVVVKGLSHGSVVIVCK